MILVNYHIDKLNLWQLVDDLITTGQSDKILFLVPTNRKIRELKKLVIQNSPGKATSKLNMHTLGTFSAEILGESIAFNEISEAAKSVFLKRSIEKTKLKYYTNYRNTFPNGALQKIGNVISKYKETGIDPLQLKHQSEKLDVSEKLKADDISNIYSELQEYCEKSHAYELGDIYRHVVNIPDDDFQSNFKKLFSSVTHIIVSGFSEFTNLELSILDSLKQIKKNKCIIEMDYYKFNPHVFGGIDKTYSKLIKSGYKEIAELREGENNKIINAFRSYFFKPTENITNIKSDKVRIIEAFDREHEVEIICKSIKKLLLVKNVKPYKIAVVFNVIDNYSDSVDYEFNKYGIPLNLTDRIKLAETSPVSTLINLFEIAETDFYYRSIARAFNSKIIGCPAVNVENLIDVANTLNVVRGYENWIRTLNNILQNSKYNVLYSEKEIDNFKKAKSSIEHIARIVDPFMKKLTIIEFISLLKKTIIDLAIPIKIAQNISSGSERHIKAFVNFYELIEDTLMLLSKSGNDAEKFDLSFFLEQLRLIAKNGRFNVKEKSDHGVLVTTLNEIRGLNFDYLFIGGMVDGDLPTRYSPEIFFAKNLMKQESEHIIEERYLFYQAVSTCRDELTLTYSRTDQGKEHSISTFLNEVQKFISPEIVDINQFEKQIYCKDEIQKSIGKISPSDVQRLNHDYKVMTDDEYHDITRRINIEEARLMNAKDFSAYNGFISGEGDSMDAELSELLSSFINKEFSASELEVFAKCPFKYFLERILKLDIKEEPSEEIEAIELGSLLHIILYEFYASLKKENIVLQGCSDNTFDQLLNRIFNLAKSKIDDLNFSAANSFYDLEKIMGINGDRKQSILYKFVEYERSQNDQLMPQYFEVSFGSTTKTNTDFVLSQHGPVEIEGIKLKGKIDRVEVSKADELFAVTDYKSGSIKPSLDDLESGTALQLPFYLLCAQVLLKNHYGKILEPQYMNLFSLKYKNGTFGKNPLKFGRAKEFNFNEFNKQMMEITSKNIIKFVSEISAGNYPLSQIENRKEKVCLYCNFYSHCRIDSLKQ